MTLRLPAPMRLCGWQAGAWPYDIRLLALVHAMAIDAYLKLDGILGESLDAHFRGQGVIQCQLLQLGDSEKETPWTRQFRKIQDLLGDDPTATKKAPGGKPPPKGAAPVNTDVSGAQKTFRDKLKKVKEDYDQDVYRTMRHDIHDLWSNLLWKIPEEELATTVKNDLKRELEKLSELSLDAEVETIQEQETAKEEAQEKKEGGGGSAQAKLCNVVLTKQLDSASPGLFTRFCGYRMLSNATKAIDPSEIVIPTGHVWARKSRAGFYMEWELENIFVVALAWSSASDGNVTENLTLQASYVTLTYRPQDATGALGTEVTRGFDFQTGTAH